MKSNIIAIALFMFTAVTVIAYPIFKDKTVSSNIPIDTPIGLPPQSETARIEVVFVLDTTGSMSGLIQAAKEKIWSIATTMASAQSAPEIKMGLVAYRDRGDTYVTKVVDLSSDLDSMYATLMDYQAGGGGDGPESVNQALYDAVHKMSWSQDQDTYKVVFLVGDAPPHMDYQDDVKYPITVKVAQAKGILINSIQCGANSHTTSKWQQIAQLGGGKYFRVDQSGSAVAVTTPFDKKIADLSKKIEDTRLYFGNKEEKIIQRKKHAATDKLHALSSVAALARRAEFNISESGKTNMYGESELVGGVSSGRVDLSILDADELPESMQDMSLDEQKILIGKKAEKRKELDREIREVSRQRRVYLKKKAEEAGGYKDSLDVLLYSAVREQAAKKGFIYKEDAPAY